MSVESTLSSVSACASCIAAIASAVTALVSYASHRKSIRRDRPKAAVFRKDPSAILVANVGSVPFTVVAAGVGSTEACRGPFALGGADDTFGPVRTIGPGGHASIMVDACARGRAWVRLADGTVAGEQGGN